MKNYDNELEETAYWSTFFEIDSPFVEELYHNRERLKNLVESMIKISPKLGLSEGKLKDILEQVTHERLI